MTDRTYRERRAARADRLEGWAAKREARSEAEYAQAQEMASQIPFGQPILVDHYSAKSDMNYRGRIARTFERSFENADKAKSMASRADGIRDQLDGAIYDDDPDALERLEERVAALEAERDRRKAANAAYRKDHKDELKAMTGYERAHAIPFPSYSLTNLGGRIKTARDRIPVIKARQARAAAAEASESGVTVAEIGHGYARVTFAEKPDREVIQALKAAGYSWGRGSWVGKADSLPAEVAKMVSP